ncbi:MAG: glycosyltransferase family 39 protein [Verrucomicrobia bacterium]|nr:glycosyltransferase family 39 protein [Verrucomicrobiota bacterium]
MRTTSASSGSSEARARWLGLPGWTWLVLLVAATGSYCIGTSFSASFRECQTAMIARNLWRDGVGGLFFPRIDWSGSGPGYMLLEFPLYNALVAMAYAVAGVRDWLGQLVSLGCSAGAVLLLYGTVRRTDGGRIALAAAALMALTPLQQFIGQCFLPEPLLMLMVMTALYGMTRHATGGGGGWLAMAAAGAAGAMLVKAPAGLVLLLPIAFLAWTRFGWGAFARPSLLLAAGCALVIYVLWQTHADRVNGQYYPYFVSTSPSQRNWNFGPLAMRWDWHFYARIAGRIFVYVSPFITLAALAGLLARTSRRPGADAPRAWWLFHVWLAANVVYVLGCANLHFAHKHYQIVFVPALAVLAARALVPLWPRWRGAVVVFAGLLLLYDAAAAFKTWREMRDPLIERSCAALREVSQPGDLVLIADFHGREGLKLTHHNNPMPLYAADRRGWNATYSDLFTSATVEEHRQKGARWLLLVVSTEKLARLAEELKTRYPPARAGDRYVILDLGGPL